MPNKPRADNPHRMVRVEDVLWDAAERACREMGTTRSAVMRKALQEVVIAARGSGPAKKEERKNG